MDNHANPEDTSTVLGAQRHLAWMMPLVFTGLMALVSSVFFLSGDHAKSAELDRRVTHLEEARDADVKNFQEMAQRLARMEPVLELIKEKLVSH